ncbi:protein of unknown function UPF0175 [Rippkaea orientalis PCC 8801]|uniref:Uncharacterized protein n=1 Tax=Rippkaea orientalis (strain PCC 8801 / RF-1) TaxID=41431 RepID=B7JWB4_RIPO1|nr:UPF0175 family protein [Rippkaea orientalis]ACK66959.1 protein of unknown function UPF0175 [Rippkaea orientalis PCC 8801]
MKAIEFKTTIHNNTVTIPPEYSDEWEGKTIRVIVLEDSNVDTLLETTISLFEQDEISLGKASEILRINQIKLQKILSQRGICVHYDVAEFQEDLELEHLKQKGYL